MADRVPQNYGNHTRFDPLFHFFALPVVMLSVIVTLVHCLHRRNAFSAWLVIFSIAIVIVTLKARLYATKLQDRIIRLEERQRLYGLLPETLRARIGELSEAQLVGLRFASDGEIPGLVEEALSPVAPASCRPTGQAPSASLRAGCPPDSRRDGGATRQRQLPASGLQKI